MRGDDVVMVTISMLQAEGLATDQEKCEVMMILLRYMCEVKQKEHTHLSDSNRASAKFEVRFHAPLTTRVTVLLSSPYVIYFVH